MHFWFLYCAKAWFFNHLFSNAIHQILERKLSTYSMCVAPWRYRVLILLKTLVEERNLFSLFFLFIPSAEMRCMQALLCLLTVASPVADLWVNDRVLGYLDHWHRWKGISYILMFKDYGKPPWFSQMPVTHSFFTFGSRINSVKGLLQKGIEQGW